MLRVSAWDELRLVAAPPKASGSTMEFAELFVWRTLRDWRMARVNQLARRAVRKLVGEAVARVQPESLLVVRLVCLAEGWHAARLVVEVNFVGGVVDAEPDIGHDCRWHRWSNGVLALRTDVDLAEMATDAITDE